jgi:hypothetical protein
MAVRSADLFRRSWSSEAAPHARSATPSVTPQQSVATVKVMLLEADAVHTRLGRRRQQTLSVATVRQRDRRTLAAGRSEEQPARDSLPAHRRANRTRVGARIESLHHHVAEANGRGESSRPVRARRAAALAPRIARRRCWCIPACDDSFGALPRSIPRMHARRALTSRLYSARRRSPRLATQRQTNPLG